ncbi:AT-hook motif nuclear-localized protein 17-like [Primulina tabacum]|uniref:AT-hook motif nuclear-localized protein 17-like n=1 Tax=Primulina tabacum TaxID=48773 RepID=UPI003F5A7078
MKYHYSTMLPKPHRQPANFQHPPPPHLHHSFPSPSAAADRPKSSEVGAHSPSNSTMKKPKDHPQPNDGASIEVIRRPRGRPPGSKNKPRPAVIVTPDSPEPPMTPYVLELPPGVDVIEAITRFCRKRNLGLCVLNGYGLVSNVTLKQPSTTPGATVTFHGRFDILSISATILPPSTSSPNLASGLANGFTITLAGPQGQMVGGIVMGPLISAATVYLISTTFNSPSYDRLPMDDSVVDGDQSTPAVSGGGMDSGGVGGDGVTAAESCGISIHSYNQPSEVIWATTARQPPPLHPPRY